MTPQATDADREKAIKEMWIQDLGMKPDGFALGKINTLCNKFISAERIATLELPEIKGLVEALMWTHPKGTPADAERLKALKSFQSLKDRLEGKK